MEQFELEDDEWDEVLEVLGAEADKRGIDSADFAAMLLLMKKIWKLLANKGQRTKKIVHAKHKRLTKNKDEQTINLKATSDELAALPPDPGDPIPDPPKPVIAEPEPEEEVERPPEPPGRPA